MTERNHNLATVFLDETTDQGLKLLFIHDIFSDGPDTKCYFRPDHGNLAKYSADYRVYVTTTKSGRIPNLLGHIIRAILTPGVFL